MKKKLISVLAAVMVLTMGTTVFAATSPTTKSVSNVEVNATQKVVVKPTETQAPATYVEGINSINSNTGAAAVKAVTDNTMASVKAEIQSQMNDVAKLADTIGSATLKQIAADNTKQVTPSVKFAADVTAPAGVTVSAANPITLDLPAPGVKAGAAVAVLHWNGTAWEVIKPDAVNDGMVKATFTSLSPVFVVEFSALTSDGKAVSPKTGSSMPVLPVMAVICMAGVAIVATKKVKCN
mgnify:FL=1